jgi:hypothetical protein
MYYLITCYQLTTRFYQITQYQIVKEWWLWRYSHLWGLWKSGNSGVIFTSEDNEKVVIVAVFLPLTIMKEWWLWRYSPRRYRPHVWWSDWSGYSCNKSTNHIKNFQIKINLSWPVKQKSLILNWVSILIFFIGYFGFIVFLFRRTCILCLPYSILKRIHLLHIM